MPNSVSLTVSLVSPPLAPSTIDEQLTQFAQTKTPQLVKFNALVVEAWDKIYNAVNANGGDGGLLAEPFKECSTSETTIARPDGTVSLCRSVGEDEHSEYAD